MEKQLERSACKYSVIRFQPFPETEEFVNIGIVIASPKNGVFDFRVQKKKRHARVTSFFHEVSRESYVDAIEMLERELSRVRDISLKSKGNPEEVRRIFDALVHPREAIIRFSEQRVQMSDNPSNVVNILFNHYVERDFASQEDKEATLEYRIKQLVQDLELDKPFRLKQVGDEFVSAKFPLVQEIDSKPSKIIKPFFLSQSEPSKIISYGGSWVDKISRMRKRRLLPQAVLFTVEAPEESDSNRHQAFDEIKHDLIKLEIQVVPSSQRDEIVRFATS
jgi:hypothetical protein